MTWNPATDPEWLRCKGWIEAALHRGGDTLTIEDVEERLASGQYVFWPALDSAMVTQVCKGRLENELNILLAGGRMGTLEAMLPSVEKFGRDMGCSLITVLGRKGWERSFVTQRAGYKTIAVLLGKRLEESAVEQGPEDTHQ